MPVNVFLAAKYSLFSHTLNEYILAFVEDSVLFHTQSMQKISNLIDYRILAWLCLPEEFYLRATWTAQWGVNEYLRHCFFP